MRKYRQFRRRGNIVVFVAIALVLILSFAALAVDGGLIYSALGEMQRAADSSALAGASGLMTQEGRERAIEYAALNDVINRPVEAGELDMTIGNWDGVTRTFQPGPDEGDVERALEHPPTYQEKGENRPRNADTTSLVVPRGRSLRGLRTPLAKMWCPTQGTRRQPGSQRR